MGMRPRKWLERKARERAHRQWGELSENVDRIGAAQLHRLRDEALGLRGSLNRFLSGTDRRAQVSRRALDALSLPGGTDWRWRPGFMAGPITPRGLAEPASGASLGAQATVWHDCPQRALILEQVRSPGVTDLSPFGLRLEVFGFSGSFLSVAIELPREALAGLTRDHVIRLETGIEVERPIGIYARLNIGHGPNTEEIPRKFADLEAGLQSRQVIEFDLAYTEMNERRLEKIWLDLIFESPRMSAVEIHELVLSRHLRAEF
ncbi:DUF6478 family protein [Paracoccus lutimaris]|uniref:Uncharacterized protein n=1 Tax=Paracoccus lutimaris TaxID=1490030 RepID=A0A368YV52_9RHOB|nr:DUF6478 family protein [Paracoccus lutimaris]RCW84081.1 hypothetical protein DFP89_10824 [Paracoccus lutimaris]